MTTALKMKLFALLLLALPAWGNLVPNPAGATGEEGRQDDAFIVGGQEVIPIGKYPWMGKSS